MGTEAQTPGRRRTSSVMDDPLVAWSLLLARGLVYASAAPALVLILPLRALLRRGVWWVTCLVAAGVVLGVVASEGAYPANVAGRYAAGQLSASVWLLSYARVEAQLPRLAPPEGIRIPTA